MIALLLQNWKYAVIGALTIVIVGLFWRNSSLHNTIERQRAEIAMLQVANSAFEQSIQRYNEALESLQDEERKRSKTAEMAILEASKTSDEHKKRANDILKQVITEDQCVASNEILSEYVKNAQK